MNAMAGTLIGIIAACTMTSVAHAGVCGPGNGDCCIDNGTPGCNDEACCNLICAADPFCCDTSWDQICADIAVTQCVECGKPPASDCCFSNGTPGCDDPFCQALICDQDPFCCDTAWDQTCVDAALGQCVVCGGDGNPGCTPDAGDCCTDNGTPGCDDELCCNMICVVDPFCCDTAWDQNCADAAVALCAACAEEDCFIVTMVGSSCHPDGNTVTFTVRGIDTCSGGSQNFVFTASGGAPGEQLCVTLLVNANGGFCCTTEICLTIPSCGPAAFDPNGLGGVDAIDFLMPAGQPTGRVPSQVDHPPAVGVEPWGARSQQGS